MKQIDVRGMSCPQPVLMAKKALSDNPEGIEVIVDNVTAKNNVLRFMTNLGYGVNIEEYQEDFILRAHK